MVNWTRVLGDDHQESAAIDFVEGNLNLREFKRHLDDESRKEINKAATQGTDYCRRVARKALRRRGVSYNLVG